MHDPKRRRMLSKYYNILESVVKEAKHANVTNNTELLNLLRKYDLEPCEVEPYTKYEENMLSGDFPTYGIYNTMRTPPGEHWFCCYKGRKYDPLGKDGSRSQEQPDDTDDCGQRCVAYLLMCKRTNAKKGIPM